MVTKCASRPPVKAKEEKLLTKGELMKIHMAIDRELVRESQRMNASFMGLSGKELTELDTVITELMKVEITDEDIDQLASDQLDGLGFLKKVLSSVKNVVNKVADKVGDVAKKVVETAGTVVKKAAQAVKWVVTLPARAVVDVILKTMKGPVAKAFVYAFIPENSPYLKNPEVARKRKLQLDTIQKIRSKLSFTTEHLNKHIRNAIVSHYKKNPEQVIHEMSAGKDKEFETASVQSVSVDELQGLGAEPVTIITAAAGLVSAVAAAATVFKKSNLPAKPDWPQPIPANENITNDPAYGDGKSIAEKAKEFVKSPVGIALGVAAALGIGVTVYNLSTD